MKDFKVQPVGAGYVDCICPIENVAAFIDAMTQIGIRITEFTWWCFVTEGHIPHGMGGPKNQYGNGWFSEISMERTCSFDTNEATKQYILMVWPTEKDYQKCYVPAFWLDIPNE